MWKENYEIWLNNKNIDAELKIEMNGMSEEQLKECFYKDVDFGTAGMRGIMSVGTNKINIHTITRATIGLAKYIHEKKFENKLVVIAYDSRNNSKKFAITAAKVLASYNIKAAIFKTIASTPVASFAIRELNACSGIVITASHNPKTDNGFKVYNETGAQLNLEQAGLLSKLVFETNDYLEFMVSEDAKENIIFIEDSVIDSYHKHLLDVKMNDVDFSNSKFIFSPLFGTSWKFINRAAKERNIEMIEVKSQIEPNGDFPGFTYPNPESKDVFESGIEIAKLVKADAVFTTDPDADRLGLAISHNNEFVFLNGNEQGILASVYLLNSLTNEKKLNDKSLILSSIVSTRLVDKIASAYNCGVEHVLTGFKFIGEKIEQYNLTGEKEYVFGFEESYGCLVKDFARDKDAIQATMLFSEMIAFYKEQNLTLVDVLEIIYRRFGYSKSEVLSYSFEGETGVQTMNLIMEKFREVKEISVKNLVCDVKVDFENDDTGLPSSNVLEFSDESKSTYIYLRPSGTEPKLKIYIEIINEDEEMASKSLALLVEKFDKLIENVR